MLKNAVAVLDVGSSKVTAIIGERAINDNFTLRAMAEFEHEAFYDGNVENPADLESAVVKALESVCSSARATINELFVGVPGEFLKVVNKQHSILLNRKRKIKRKDLSDLFDGAVSSVNQTENTIIDRSAVYYFIDGNTRVPEPIGKVSDSLNGYLSFFTCKNVFIDAIKNSVSPLAIKEIHFVPIPLAESFLLFSREERYGYEILVDVGYISTSVSIILGDGMLYQGAFPMGGGHVSAYLMDNLKINYSLAEKLKRKINLSMNLDVQSSYEVFVSDEQYMFNVATCNDVVCNVLDGIAEGIEKQLRESNVKLPHQNNVCVSLTGGGISFMRGAKEYLRSRIDMYVNVVAPNVPFMNKPDESSKLALLDYALNYKNNHV